MAIWLSIKGPNSGERIWVCVQTKPLVADKAIFRILGIHKFLKRQRLNNEKNMTGNEWGALRFKNKSSYHTYILLCCEMWGKFSNQSHLFILNFPLSTANNIFCVKSIPTYFTGDNELIKWLVWLLFAFIVYSIKEKWRVTKLIFVN